MSDLLTRLHQLLKAMEKIPNARLFNLQSLSNQIAEIGPLVSHSPEVPLPDPSVQGRDPVRELIITKDDVTFDWRSDTPETCRVYSKPKTGTFEMNVVKVPVAQLLNLIEVLNAGRERLA